MPQPSGRVDERCGSVLGQRKVIRETMEKAEYSGGGGWSDRAMKMQLESTLSGTRM